MKDAPRLWRKRLHTWLVGTFKFVQSVWDECIYHWYPMHVLQ